MKKILSSVFFFVLCASPAFADDIYIDQTYFGYGVGLVMIGWVAGLVVSIFLSVVGRIRHI